MATTTPGAAEVELAIGGMTCASCAARDREEAQPHGRGQATVNYATEKAKVTLPGEDVSVAGPDRHRRGHRLHRRTARARTPEPDPASEDGRRRRARTTNCGRCGSG